MNLEDFDIGDILSKDNWQGVTYEVMGITDGGSLILRASSDGHTFTWDGYPYERDLVITKVDTNKTPVERKIAHLYKLFEERKMK